jgi:hypothetical protein
MAWTVPRALSARLAPLGWLALLGSRALLEWPVRQAQPARRGPQE